MPDETAYEICLENMLDEKWAVVFKPFTMVVNTHTTSLIGNVHDQAELFGLLLKIRDLGLTLISVNQLHH